MPEMNHKVTIRTQALSSRNSPETLAYTRWACPAPFQDPSQNPHTQTQPTPSNCLGFGVAWVFGVA